MTYIEQNLDSVEIHFSERPQNNIKFSEGSTTNEIDGECSIHICVYKALFDVH